jgi:hypothetical protein
LRHNTCASARIFARNQPKQTKDLECDVHLQKNPMCKSV